MDWTNRAVAILDATRTGAAHELNELDWKLTLSPDKRRLTEHLSAFANYPGGGYLVFGVDNDGVPRGVATADIDPTMATLTNLARSALEPALTLMHAVVEYQDVPILFVHIPESAMKPVVLRGKQLDQTFVRVGGTTRSASRQEVGSLMLNSRTPRWEDLNASTLLDDDGLIGALSPLPILELLGKPIPGSKEDMLSFMRTQEFIARDPRSGGHVTNLGAITAARELAAFADLSRKSVRVIVYQGRNKVTAKHERLGHRGYAVGFDGLLSYVSSHLPQGEVIDRAFRRTMPIFPSIALREVIANALIHQDFSMTGTGPLIEIYDDRIEISNPGALLPTKSLHRLIGTQPESRNEKLARAFRMYRICEERGSGILKAAQSMEMHGLPAMKFQSDQGTFKVTMYGPRTYAEMSVNERLEACYQHAVVKHFSSEPMTNKSLRERLRMPESRRSMVSALIQLAMDHGLIKPADPDNRSRKFMQYQPFWA